MIRRGHERRGDAFVLSGSAGLEIKGKHADPLFAGVVSKLNGAIQGYALRYGT